MSQKSDNYSWLSGPRKSNTTKPLKRGNSEESPCKCSITYRQEYIASSFRMVAIAIILLFGFTVLLFVWNIVLWREVAHLQSHVTTLQQAIEKTSMTSLLDCDVTMTPTSDRSGENWRKTKNDEKRYYASHQKSEPADDLLRREKRSALEAPAESQFRNPTPVDTEIDLLSRIKRSGKKNSGKRRGGKGKRPKKDRTMQLRRKRHAFIYQGKRRLSKATAIHVPISGSIPYRGMRVSGPDGTIQHWNTNPTVNHGFNINSINRDGVVIEEAGVYFIYSQVTFKMGAGVEVHEKIQTGATGSTELTSCSNPIPSNASDSYVTCYSSGIKHLRAGDKIQIQVHPNDLLVFVNPSYTYFGAFLLGS